MQIIPTAIPDVLVLAPRVFGDSRGFFLESYNERVFAGAVGATPHFVQDNHSRSARGVLRGLHYQVQQPQGKLVRVTQGSVFDVAVDLRRSSPTGGFRAWLSRDQRLCRFPLQDHRLLGARARALSGLG